MSENIVHKWAMIFNIIIGISLVIIALSTIGHMKSACTNRIITNGMNAVLAIGAILITLGIVFFVCGPLDCYGQGATQASIMYMTVAIAVSVIVLGIAGAMMKELRKDTNKKNCGQHTNTLVILVMVIAIITGGVSGYSLLRIVDIDKEIDIEDKEISKSSSRLNTFGEFRLADIED